MLTFFALLLWPGSTTPSGPAITIVDVKLVEPDVHLILIDPSVTELIIVAPT